MIPPKIFHALKFIIDHLQNLNIRWVLVGSLSLALQGVEISPQDIDILTDEHGAYTFADMFKAYTHTAVQFKRTTLFESHFGQFTIQGIQVDIMGDLRVNLDNTWTPLIHRLETAKYITTQGLTIPVSPLHDQLESYEKLGRPKDADRIARIRQTLQRPRT